MRCFIFEDRVAVWKLKKSDVHLSAVAAGISAREGLLDFDDLRMYGPCTFHTDHGATDPISASFKLGYGVISGLVSGFSDVYIGMNRTRSTKSENTADSSPTKATGTRDPDVSASGGQSDTSSQTKKGLKTLGTVPLKTIVEVPASLAQGLHDAPKLYGDDTVRQPDKITGWKVA